MARSNEIFDELQSLNVDLTHVLSSKADDVLSSSQRHLDEMAMEVKAALQEIGTALKDDEEHLEQLVAAHPLAALATAFALGLSVGAALRRSL